MNNVTNNRGVVTFGGTTQVTGSAIGDGATVNVGDPAPKQTDAASRPQRAWDVGVITMLAVEMQAVQTVLDLGEEPAGGPPFATGSVEVPGGVASVVVTRTLSQGQRSVMAALQHLHHHYDPAVLALVGIGGAIHPDLTLGDVAVATRVVYYDLRKVTPEKVFHRGEEHQAPAWAVHGVNSFFTEHGEPAEFPAGEATGQSGHFRVFPGPIGSGDAVIADGKSEIRSYLSSYNDKILAVDMEAGGLSQFCHERSSTSGRVPGWVVIRGISDPADHAKDDDWHHLAAMNAASTLRNMLPYLRISP